MKIFGVCFGCMPQRYLMALMAFFGIAMAYILRNCLSMAVTDMIKPRHAASAPHTGSPTVLPNGTVITTTPKPKFADPCPNLKRDIAGKKMSGKGPSYSWTEKQQGSLMGMFYLGYFFTHIPGGIAADYLGAKHVFGGGILVSAFCSIASPISASIHIWMLYFIRILMGCAQGVLFPAANVLLARWIPPSERGLMGSVVMAATQIGNVVCNTGSGFIMMYIEWRAVFYIWGILGIIWYCVFLMNVYSEPSSHPFISDKEKEYLSTALSGVTDRKALVVSFLDTGKIIQYFVLRVFTSLNISDVPRIPVFSILTSVPVWALIVCQIGHNYGLFTIQNFFPKYMKQVLKFSSAKNGIYSSLPYLAMWITAISSGILIDWIIKKEYLSRLTTRRIFCLIAQVGPGCGCVVAAYIGCHRLASIITFTIAMGLMGPFWPSMKVNALDLAPNYAGFLMALINGIGSISGTICSFVLGSIIKEATVPQWQTVFWIGNAIISLTGIFYFIFSSADLQKWNNPGQQAAE